MSGLVAVPALGQTAVPTFSGDRAMELLIAQCDLGLRTPGSEGNEALRVMIETAAREHGLSVTRVCFKAEIALSGAEFDMCNLVVSTPRTGGDRLWLGAHYDTRPVCDQDPDPALRDHPLVGANDGASGVAVLLHVMEILGQTPPPGGVDLIFFDGEDSGRAGHPREYCLGSADLAARWNDFGSPLAGPRPRGLIVLDMVGDKQLQIPMEGFSARYAPDLTRHIFDRAAALQLDGFLPTPGMEVYDDHVPFLEQGIPAVDLIDFDYPPWHTTGDTPDKCSGESLGQVGRLVVDLIYNP